MFIGRGISQEIMVHVNGSLRKERDGEIFGKYAWLFHKKKLKKFRSIDP